jgi:hypothetical protein
VGWKGRVYIAAGSISRLRRLIDGRYQMPSGKENRRSERKKAVISNVSSTAAPLAMQALAVQALAMQALAMQESLGAARRSGRRGNIGLRKKTWHRAWHIL